MLFRSKAFCDLEEDVLKVAMMFTMNWGAGIGQNIVWEILPDSVHIVDKEDPMNIPEELEYSGKFLADEHLSLEDQFFKHVFPQI